MIKLSRKFLVILVAIILGINLPQLDAQESGDLQYNTYANARFNYTIKYPLNILIPQGESANGDGQKFISPDGQAILTVWGEYNALDESLKNRYNEVLNKLSGSITYKILKDNVFVISCYQGNKIFYQKTILINSMFKTFIITYSKSYRQLFDPIVKEISSSFCSPSARGQTEFYGLPDGAQVVEIQPIKSERHPQRALILWVLYPQKNPRSNPDEPYSCPELTRGHYYNGPTRVSLINTQDQTIINTIEIIQEYNKGKEKPAAILGGFECAVRQSVKVPHDLLCHPRLCGRLGNRSQKTVLGTSWPRENTPKFMFLKPNPLVDAMVAQVSLKK
jgi:hypothetical protein